MLDNQSHSLFYLSLICSQTIELSSLIYFCLEKIVPEIRGYYSSRK